MPIPIVNSLVVDLDELFHIRPTVLGGIIAITDFLNNMEVTWKGGMASFSMGLNIFS